MNIDVSDSSRVESGLFSTLLPVSVLKSRLLHVQLQLYYTKGSLICYRACEHGSSSHVMCNLTTTSKVPKVNCVFAFRAVE